MYKILSVCKGGGYMYCRTYPKHPKANSKGLYAYHRVLMENSIGRSLLDNEDVHHKDEDKTNNCIENLEILTKSEHAKLHIILVDNIKITCSCCGIEFELKPHLYRLRKQRNKTHEVFCSRSCATKISSKLKKRLNLCTFHNE